MKRARLPVWLIHWKTAETPERMDRLRAAGFEPLYSSEIVPAMMRALEAAAPAAVVIDLGRLPSHGREVGHALRMRKTTRLIPLVYLGGEPEKVARIRELLPDAFFGDWSAVRDLVLDAVRSAPANPVRPPDPMAQYAGRPLPKKLGIKENTLAVAVAPPDGFLASLGPLPEGARIETGDHSRGELYVWFVRSAEELHRDLTAILKRTRGAPLWIAYPKKIAAAASGLTQPAVRKAGLALGWVDCKVCAIDETWSGLVFRRRK
jgi:hypothetical protein